MFVLPCPQATLPPTDRIFLRRAKQNLKESACTSLFCNAFEKRNAGSCVHTHPQNAVMATLLWEGDFFEISHQVGVGSRTARDRRPDNLLRVDLVQEVSDLLAGWGLCRSEGVA